MKKVYDLKGNELKLVLLQVLDKQPDGTPITLRVRQDHEEVGLADERHRTFYMVWVAVDQKLAGETTLQRVLDEMYGFQENLAKTRADLDEAILACQSAQRRSETQAAENEVKTADLRRLRDAEDPTLFAARVHEAVAKRTENLELVATRARAELADARREIEELRASKAKLKERVRRLEER